MDKNYKLRSLLYNVNANKDLTPWETHMDPVSRNRKVPQSYSDILLMFPSLKKNQVFVTEN
jgi:hypothetical protein